jgi:L,D-transpeptidase ErfK/SrfK
MGVPRGITARGGGQTQLPHGLGRAAPLVAAVALASFATVAQASTYPLSPESGVVGVLQSVATGAEDTLSDVARHFGVGWTEITRANPGVDPWLPGAGARVTVPTEHVLPHAPHDGLVLNLPEMRLYYFPHPQAGYPPVVMTYPVSIGRMDWSTPLGFTRVVAKERNPVWRPPASIRAEHAADGDDLPAVVAAGPDNPLGQFALRLAMPGYLIHGTNKPYGVGMRVSHGCVRLYPEDIEQLFQQVPVGTPVRIINQPYKAGWRNGALFLESHQPLDGQPVRNFTPAVRVVVAATLNRPVRIDWDVVERVASEARGIPIRISR